MGNDEGQYLYAIGDAETHAWFEKQWRIWPERADERLTASISFHHSAVKGYRIKHGKEPELSSEFAGHVAFLDKCDERKAKP